MEELPNKNEARVKPRGTLCELHPFFSLSCKFSRSKNRKMKSLTFKRNSWPLTYRSWNDCNDKLGLFRVRNKTVGRGGNDSWLLWHILNDDILNFQTTVWNLCFTPRVWVRVSKNLNQRRTYLIGAGGLVGPVVVAKVLVRLRRLRFCVSRRLVDGRDVVAQGDGFHGLVDATADALANLGCWRLRLLQCRWWSAGVTAGGLGCGLWRRQGDTLAVWYTGSAFAVLGKIV